MNRTCACGRTLDFFGTTGGLRSYCSGCGKSTILPPDEWPRTQHQIRDHRSHGLTEAQRLIIEQANRPIKPQICQNCKWPASMHEICMLCADMLDAVLKQPGLVDAHEKWRRIQMERRLGLL